MSETDNWIEITLDEAFRSYGECMHVTHCMLWFRCLSHTDITYTLVQMRFDGLFGFPGGIVDQSVDNIAAVIAALRREMLEEVNYSGVITDENYVYSHFNKTQNFVSHFFAKKLSVEEANHLEQTHTKAYDFPKESLGLFRVPIGDIRSNVLPSHYLRRFFKNFFQHKFAGNMRTQILDVCEKFNIMSATEIEWTKRFISKT